MYILAVLRIHSIESTIMQVGGDQVPVNMYPQKYMHAEGGAVRWSASQLSLASLPKENEKTIGVKAAPPGCLAIGL